MNVLLQSTFISPSLELSESCSVHMCIGYNDDKSGDYFQRRHTYLYIQVVCLARLITRKRTYEDQKGIQGMVIRLPLPPRFTGYEFSALSRVPTLSRIYLLFLEQQQAERSSATGHGAGWRRN